jgi:hypothetical protein
MMMKLFWWAMDSLLSEADYAEDKKYFLSF